MVTLNVTVKMDFVRKSLGYNWTDYKTNTEASNELKITSVLEKSNCTNHVNRMPRNGLSQKKSPKGRKIQ